MELFFTNKSEYPKMYCSSIEFYEMETSVAPIHQNDILSFCSRFRRHIVSL